jgi:hypothetical protein
MNEPGSNATQAVEARRSPVSKRHQVHRRHAYGRRQHEVRERIERSHPRDLAEFDADPFEAAEESEGFGSLFDFDLRGRRFNWAVGE